MGRKLSERTVPAWREVLRLTSFSKHRALGQCGAGMAAGNTLSSLGPRA